jgi:sulfite reductase (NADPH) flavoprotein alpha-component
LKKKLKVLDKYRLSSDNHDKAVYHFSLDRADIVYEVGDVLKIYPENDPKLTHDISKLYGDESFHEYELRVGNDALMHKLAEIDNSLQTLLSPINFVKYRKHLLDHTVPELLSKHGKLDIEILKSLLSPMRARSYSIASSMKKHPNEIHLTISLNKFDTNKGTEIGTSSGFIIERVEIGDEIYGFHKPHPKFKLPEDNSKDIIMIGPGTGIAPFIGFLQEREDLNGQNWLFFGERTKEDFYYKDFLQALEAKGKLKLDLAFSREQEEKIYVQHLVDENRAEFKKWIKNNATIYICGDKNMAKDVEEVILSILDEDRSKSEAEFNHIKEAGRFKLDVY